MYAVHVFQEVTSYQRHYNQMLRKLKIKKKIIIIYKKLSNEEFYQNMSRELQQCCPMYKNVRIYCCMIEAKLFIYSFI